MSWAGTEIQNYTREQFISIQIYMSWLQSFDATCQHPIWDRYVYSYIETLKFSAYQKVREASVDPHYIISIISTDCSRSMEIKSRALFTSEQYG